MADVCKHLNKIVTLNTESNNKGIFVYYTSILIQLYYLIY